MPARAQSNDDVDLSLCMGGVMLRARDRH
jgi:hypothetical protein